MAEKFIFCQASDFKCEHEHVHEQVLGFQYYQKPGQRVLVKKILYDNERR